MGASSITWVELDAYSRLSCSNLTAWEAEQIINMSSQYCSYLIKGKKPCEPPYQREFDADDIKAQNAAFDKMLAAEEKAMQHLKA